MITLANLSALLWNLPAGGHAFERARGMREGKQARHRTTDTYASSALILANVHTITLGYMHTHNLLQL